MSTRIRCTHCKQSFDGASQAHHSLHRPSSIGDGVTVQRCASDEVSAIYEEILQLDAAIQQLQTVRSMLLDKINAIRARTAVLPPEVLCRIFRFVHPSQPFYAHPYDMRIEQRPPVLQLAAVCSAWRQVAFSTPELWTTLSMILLHPTGRNDAAILQTFFENARGLPIFLKLNFGFYDFENFGPDGLFRNWAKSLSNNLSSKQKQDTNSHPIPSEHVLETLLSNAEKIRAFQIDYMPFNWVTENDWELFTNLQDLRLLYNGEWEDRVYFPNCIQKLFLQSVANYAITPQSSACNITDLEIHDAPMNIPITLLTECPNLIRCRSATPQGCDSSPSFGINTFMQHLEVLDWECDSSIWHCAFLQQFQFPALRKLRWKVLEPLGDERAFSALFFERLPLTIEKLELVFACYFPENVTGLLDATALWVPHLPELVIDMQLPPWVDDGNKLEAYQCNARAVLDMLGMKGPILSEKRPFLPALTKLYLRMDLPRSIKLDGNPRMESNQLVRMLMTRRELGLTEFQLFWDGDLDLVDGSNMGKLRELFMGGLDLWIVKRSNLIYPKIPDVQDDQNLSHDGEHGTNHS